MNAPADVTDASSPEDGPPSPEVHHRHRDVTGGWLRPSIFGVMDGLVSNFALVAGVAGAGVAPGTVAAAGLAGLVGGAFSMASGEYVSVRSERELAEAEIEKERIEVRDHPEAEQAELAAMYRGRGLAPDLADEVARQMSADPKVALRLHVREELGVDLESLSRPKVAAGSSFVSFTLGALVPLVPYLLGATSLLVAAVLSVVALFLTGALTARFTARGALYSGGRQLLVGVVSAAATYGVGTVLGAGLA